MSPSDPGVDVVVPIFNARSEVERCVDSVLRHAEGDWRLRLIDDASSDAALVELLRSTALRHERVHYDRLERNSGFVAAANRGMKAAAGRDVLLLNSDTVVSRGFIAKHVDCVYADSETGIASPFTDNGTICSLPDFCEPNEIPEDLGIDGFAELVAATSLRRRPEIVSAVGFCMYVRAEVFARIGYFDELRFGRGFGEENDFCERARMAGFRVRLVDDCFVAHRGGASFGAEARSLQRRNSRMLARLHPGYFPAVDAFCRENPLHDLQQRVRVALARRHDRLRPSMLMLLHASPFSPQGGGTEFAVKSLIEGLALPRVVLAYPSMRGVAVAEVFRGNTAHAIHYEAPLSRPTAPFEPHRDDVTELLRRVVEDFDVEVAHLQHLLGWPLDAWGVLAERGIPFAYSIHDQHALCPSWNRIRLDTGTACDCPGDADPQATRACLAAQFDALNLRPPRDAVALRAQHRASFDGLLRAARVVIAPSEAACRALASAYPDALHDARCIPHGYDLKPEPARASEGPTRATGTLRVALLGQIAMPAKGADIYLRLMRELRGRAFQWHLFGNSDLYAYRRRLEELGLGPALRVHGAYRREEIVDLLARHEIDLCLILPQADESFGLTLSESWLAGVPAIVSRSGALPERMGDSGAGIVVRDATQARAELLRLLADRDALSRLKAKARAYRHPSVAECVRSHRCAYGDLLEPLSASAASRPITPAELRWLGRLAESAEAENAAAPGYHRRWWYPAYRRAHPLLPPGLRAALKRWVLRAERSAR